MKQKSPQVMTISINSILLWVFVLITFVIALYALFKKSATTTGCDIDTIANELINTKDFVQNYTTIYPSAIECKYSSEGDPFVKIDKDGDNPRLTFDETFTFSGEHATMQLLFNDTSNDIVRIENKDDEHYWYYNYDNKVGTNSS
jgi:hypothetical protein